MTDPSSLALFHRELFVWFAHRPDVRHVDYEDAELTIAPNERRKEDGSAWPALVRVKIPLDELAAAWPTLCSGAEALGLHKNTDLAEIGVFSLLDVHLDEAVNSLREPGPNGYRYANATFRGY